jgi:hypothetical protein
MQRPQLPLIRQALPLYASQGFFFSVVDVEIWLDDQTGLGSGSLTSTDHGLLALLANVLVAPEVATNLPSQRTPDARQEPALLPHTSHRFQSSAYRVRHLAALLTDASCPLVVEVASRSRSSSVRRT